jgi:hypothetical protein
MQETANLLDPEVGKAMAAIAGPVIVVVDYGTIAVFDAAKIGLAP